MSVKWEDTLTPALEELKKRLEKGEHLVKVGLPDDPKVDADGRALGQLTLGDTARINEFGTEDGRVPERPAWRQGLKGGAPDFNRLNRVNLARVAQGKIPLETALGQLGAMGASKVREEILDGEFTPNAPSTIARKGSSHPLVDTAQEKNSITWEVVRG